MIWVVFALAASVLYAAYGQVNRHFQLPGMALSAYRGAVPFLLLLPCLPFIPLPQAWEFYALTALNGLVISFSDTRFFEASARYGGAQVLRLQPLVLILVFLFWAPLDWPHTEQLLANPPLALGVCAALAAASVSLYFMTRTPVTSQALRFYLPAVLATGLIDPINKLTTRYTHGLPGALCYAVFTSFFVFLFLAPRMVWGRSGSAGGVLSEVFAGMTRPGYALAGMLIGCISIAFNIAKNLAMARTPNPAFVTAVIFCAGLWATVYVRLRGEPDEYDTVAAMVFIASAITLMLLAAVV